MNRSVAIAVFLYWSAALVSIANAKEVNAITPNTVTQPGSFHLLRSEEDYRYFKDPESRHGFLDDIKYLSLNSDGSNYLTLGGMFREEYEYFDNENWGVLEAPDKHLLTRVMLDADLHFGFYSRIFLELKSAFESWNSYPSRPIDVDHFDFNQFFTDQKWHLADERAFTIRLGESELDYGAERLIAVREGPNVRLGFVGIKTMFNFKKSRWDNFWVLPVNTYPGVVDDRPTIGEQLWASYLTCSLIDVGGPAALPLWFDVYYIGFRHDNAVFAAGSGNELRHSMGGRLYKDSKSETGYDFDFESLYQFGSFRDQGIKAWTVATDQGYTVWPLPFQPRFAIKGAIASGDENQGRGALGTFNPLFPRGGYLEFASEIGPSNFISVNPYVNTHLSKTLALTIGFNALWRESAEDGIYNPGGGIIRGPGNTRARFIGGDTAITASYQVGKNFNFIAGLENLSAGNYIRETGPASASRYASIYAYFIY